MALGAEDDFFEAEAAGKEDEAKTSEKSISKKEHERREREIMCNANGIIDVGLAIRVAQEEGREDRICSQRHISHAMRLVGRQMKA
jgi:hypothetical protein